MTPAQFLRRSKFRGSLVIITQHQTQQPTCFTGWASYTRFATGKRRVANQREPPVAAGVEPASPRLTLSIVILLGIFGFLFRQLRDICAPFARKNIVAFDDGHAMRSNILDSACHSLGFFESLASNSQTIGSVRQL